MIRSFILDRPAPPTSTTSSVEPGNTTRPGLSRKLVRPSHSYVRSSSGSLTQWAGPTTAPSTAPSTPALRAYEHFKSLAGEWEGHSTKGWTERLTIRCWEPRDAPLLADDPSYRDRAHLWDRTLRDIQEWLVEIACRRPVAAPWARWKYCCLPR
jgi:hypothetical protein